MTFHVNCLPSRHCIWNINTFLWKKNNKQTNCHLLQLWLALLGLNRIDLYYMIRWFVFFGRFILEYWNIMVWNSFSVFLIKVLCTSDFSLLIKSIKFDTKDMHTMGKKTTTFSHAVSRHLPSRACRIDARCLRGRAASNLRQDLGSLFDNIG